MITWSPQYELDLDCRYEWRISYRLTIFDWNQNQDATAIWNEPSMEVFFENQLKVKEYRKNMKRIFLKCFKVIE